jgi:2,3-dihydroxyphenylpropionate 1,2-dioxygenase
MTQPSPTGARRRAAGIVAAAAVPHAPQFLSRPETEDLDQVERVRACLAGIGEAFRRKEPDCIVVISNDHGDHFVTHSVPAFCVHVAASADGMHKHRGNWALDGALGYALVPEMSSLGFDLAFTLGAHLQTAFTIPYEFMGFDRQTPMTAIFVNAYVPPQPSATRCFAFGQALERALCKLGRRAILVASGGLSHYPGTRHYPHPDVKTDERIFARLCEGDLQHLVGFNDREMDRTGNVELRSTLMLAGAIGDRKPFAAQFEPSWHHIYATLAWDLEVPNPLVDDYDFIYPALPGARVPLVEAIFRLRTSPEDARRFIADPAAWCDTFRLAPDEQEALVAFDVERLRDQFRIHALLTAGAATQVGLQRQKGKA